MPTGRPRPAASSNSSSAALPFPESRPGLLAAVGALPPVTLKRQRDEETTPASDADASALVDGDGIDLNADDGAAAQGPPPTIPAPNPAIGIASREEAIKTLLRFFAKSDFRHDFGEKVPARDWITWGDLTRFTEMVQRFPVKQRTTMINMFTKMFPEPAKKEEAVGNNLLNLLQGEIASQLYPDPDTGGLSEFITEEKILEKIGVKYEDLKGVIKGFIKSRPRDVFPGKLAGDRLGDIKIGHNGVFSRNYRVGAQRYKNDDKSTRNLASLFKDVTGGATKFALLIDASLGMSVTSVGDSTLTPDPGAPCEFIILQNVEGDADSATGATDFKITNRGFFSNNTKVRMMRDFDTTTVLYPIWNKPAAPSDAEILFSKIQVILNRVEAGDIEASILLETADGRETHSIPDVGTTSNVKNASLNGLAAWFASQILGRAATMGDQRKPYIYALLKRMGDWCQALSLLDRIRTYKEMDPKTKKEKIPTSIEKVKVATLQELITEGYEIGIVTCDRILLAYALILGLNVYFTTASDLNCLLYFKNQDDIVDETMLATNAGTNYGSFLKVLYGEEEMTRDSAGVKASIDIKIGEAQSEYSIVIPPPSTGATIVEDGSAAGAAADAYDTFLAALTDTIKSNFGPAGEAPAVLDAIVKAFAVKVILSNLKELRTNFSDIRSDMTKHIDTYYLDAATPKQKFDAAVSLVNLATRLDMDTQHNKDVIAQLNSGKFSGNMFTAQQNVFVDLWTKMKSGVRMSTSEIMKRAKDLLLSCQDDIKEVMQKKIMTPAQLLKYLPELPAEAARGSRPSDKDIVNLATLYGAFVTLRTEIGAPARGGGQSGGDNKDLLNAVKQREVFPYKSAKLETTVNKLKALAEPPEEDVAIAASAERARVAAQKQLDLLDFLPVVQLGTYYRDEKSRPYSVIDRYLITKEDSKVLEKLYETFFIPKQQPLTAVKKKKNLVARVQTPVAPRLAAVGEGAPADGEEAVADQPQKRVRTGEGEVEEPDAIFVFYRFALLYHDILYERYEHAYDEWNTEGTFSDEVEIEDSEMTEGTRLEFINVAREAAVLRLAVTRFANEERLYTPGDRTKTASYLLKSFREGISDSLLDEIDKHVTTAERVIFRPFQQAVIKNTLVQARDVIFKFYKPIKFVQYDQPLNPDGSEAPTIPAAAVEDLIDKGELPLPAAVAPADDDDEEEAALPARATPFTWRRTGVGEGAPVPSGVGVDEEEDDGWLVNPTGTARSSSTASLLSQLRPTFPAPAARGFGASAAQAAPGTARPFAAAAAAAEEEARRNAARPFQFGNTPPAQGLQSAARPLGNASGSPFTFGRGGRRRLYAGLRKRGGSGSPPGI